MKTTDSSINKLPWNTGGLPVLSIAMTCIADDVLGPGRRFVVWTQGCRRDCSDCVSQEWRPLKMTVPISPDELGWEIVNSGVSGITLSGGEPMLQAAGLAQVVKYVRRCRDISLICYTGYTLEQLLGPDSPAGAWELLDVMDVLIDGPYIAALNDNRGLRGSANQRAVVFTSRLAAWAEALPLHERTAEIRVVRNGVALVGIPPSGVSEAYRRITRRFDGTQVAITSLNDTQQERKSS